MAWGSREAGLYRTSLNLPSPAMLFSNGEEQPSTASSPQSTSETPDSTSSDIAEPSSLPPHTHPWNLWNTVSNASSQITLEDIIHESAIIELVSAGISRPFHADSGPGRTRIFSPQTPLLPRKIFYSIVTRMHHSTLCTYPKLLPSRPKRLLTFTHSHQPLSSTLLRLPLFSRLSRLPQRVFYDPLLRFDTYFQLQYAINYPRRPRKVAHRDPSQAAN
jgi:hypothetical protein